MLDGIEDPHNLGAILRTADAAGADGVVVQSRRSAALGGAAAKASAGAVAHVRIAEVVNIARALDELKDCRCMDRRSGGRSENAIRHASISRVRSAIVLGAEGAGLRRLVRERCDYLVSIPMLGHVESLNVSVAAGVTLFEAVRQRRGAAADMAQSADGLTGPNGEPAATPANRRRLRSASGNFELLRDWHGKCYDVPFVWLA